MDNTTTYPPHWRVYGARIMLPLLHKKSLADAIRARGFRKWYEGRLIEGHLHLITAFLCLIAVLGAIEQGGPYNTLG